jgi:hypothetical protein
MMNWRYIKYSISLFLLIETTVGCIQSDYTKLVKSELAKGIRKDSVLYGINFGDTQQDFYRKCTELNKMQLANQGPNGSVQFNYKDSLVHKMPTDIKILMFTTFDQSKVISNVDLEMSYSGWAPWNRHLQSDSLTGKVMKLLTLWYKGNDFVIVNANDSTQIPVKLDGNRRILVMVKDPQSVLIKVQDILHPNFMHSKMKSESKAGRKN